MDTRTVTITTMGMPYRSRAPCCHRTQGCRVSHTGRLLSTDLNVVRPLLPCRPISAHARHRESPYPLVSVADAILTIIKEVRPLPDYEEPVSACG